MRWGERAMRGRTKAGDEGARASHSSGVDDRHAWNLLFPDQHARLLSDHAMRSKPTPRPECYSMCMCACMQAHVHVQGCERMCM